MTLTQKEFASSGGKATLKKYGKEHFQKMNEKSRETQKKTRTPEEWKEFSRKGIEARRLKRLEKAKDVLVQS